MIRFQQHFTAKFPERKRSYKTPGKNRLLSWQRHNLTIIREDCALEFERLVLFLLKPVFINHLIWKGMLKTQNAKMRKWKNDKMTN